MFIVTSRHDRELGLPSSEYDVPLMVADRTFDADNKLESSFHIGMVQTGPHAPPVAGSPPRAKTRLRT